MFQSKKPKSSRGVCHARKFRADASCDTRCSRALNTQLPREIAERAFYLLSRNGWAEFLPEPMKFLVAEYELI